MDEKQYYINRMVDSLIYQAEKHGLELWEVAVDNVNDLDDVFEDGGEIRCEQFVDFAYEYASEFHSFDSTPFHNLAWELIDAAMEEIRRRA